MNQRKGISILNRGEVYENFIIYSRASYSTAKLTKMKNIIFSALALCLMFWVSCGKSDVNIDPISKLGLHKIGEKIQGDIIVVIWGDKSVETGYEKLFLQFTDKSNSAISNGQVTLLPLMNMNTNGKIMSHSAPADPVKLGDDQLFETGVVFTMPSDGENGKWVLTIDYTSLSKETVSFKIPVEVKVNTEDNLKTVTFDNGDRYVLSFYLNEEPRIGVNDANFTLHKLVSMMSFPAFSAATMKMDPRMPDMDNHGSPNNVNPAHKQNGHYSGKLNYTMSGFWIVNLELMIDGRKITTSFDQTF